MADQNQGGGENQNQNNQNPNNQSGQGAGAGDPNQGAGNQGGEGGDDGQGGEKLEAVKNADGTITIDGKKYVDGKSYDVLAEKQRQNTLEKEKREKAEKEAEQKRLEEQGKFKELAEAKEKEANDLKVKYENQTKVNALQAEATKLGAVDLDAVVKLANLEDVKLAEDGSIDAESVKKVVEDMKTNKAYLFSEGGNPNIGSEGGNPAGNSTTPTFKRSQLRDHEFYKAHEKEIEQAYKEGKIIDDISGR